MNDERPQWARRNPHGPAGLRRLGAGSLIPAGSRIAAGSRLGAGPRIGAGWVLAALAIAGCSASDGGPAGPPAEAPPSSELGDPAAGAVAFVQSCAECHTSRDGFDLAHFGYPSRDVVRRALGHVDTATAIDIDAYIRSLDVSRATPRVAPFQPVGRVGHSDLDFWKEAFGTEYWPAGLTADALRAIDPRDLSVPLVLPQWSDEGSNEDWLPDTALPGRVLDWSSGLVRAALSAYYAAPSDEALVAVLEGFDQASKSTGGMCSEADPEPCFNARRWMASLAAQHYLRSGEPESVPVAVAQVWWDVGKSAIAQQSLARSADERARAFRNGSRWMYLGYAFAPEAFEEPAGYMGTFLIGSADLRRVATFAALRRMVGDGRAHRTNPLQFFHDGKLASDRVPVELELDLALFVLGHFLDRLETRGRAPNLDLAAARLLVTEVWNDSRGSMWRDPVKAARIDQLRDQVLQLLQ